MSEATLIFNPMAGLHDSRSTLNALAEMLRHRGWQIDVHATNHSGHATELARAAALKKQPLVFALGGDGTINEVVNGLVGSETILAPLPVGTANCLAKELKLTGFSPQQDNLIGATEALLDGLVHAVDVGRCITHGSLPRYWLLWASVGFDSYVVHHVEPRSRQFKRFGKLAYTAKTLSLLPGFSGMEGRVTVDGDSVAGEFLLINVSNARWFAGGELYLNPFGKLDDGNFEVWLIHGHAWPELVRSGIDIVRQIHARQPQIQTLRGRHIEIVTTRPQPAHMDGEPAQTTPLTCDLIPGALQLLTPRLSPKELFQNQGLVLNLSRPSTMKESNLR